MGSGQFQVGDPPVVRFSRAVEADPNSGCWLWSAGRNSDGYGTLKVHGKTVMAHRFSWVLANGEIPAGLCALHKCDTPSCVNPTHLFLGTRGDNARDKAAKGRCHDNGGERHGMAKLTDVQVACIRIRLGEGQTQSRIAADYGVAQCTISDIATGRRRQPRSQRSHA
jgi:hypothetical protein